MTPSNSQRAQRRPDWWFRISSVLVDEDMATFKTFTAFKVEIAIRRYADAEGIAWPSLSKLAKVTGASQGNVSRAIKELVESGRIERTESGSPDGRSTRYRLLVDVPDLHAPAHTPTCAGASDLHAPAHTPTCAGASRTIPRTLPLEIDPKNKTAAVAAGDKGDGAIRNSSSTMHKPKAESVALPPVPDSLATPEFLKTWSDWQAARRTMKPSVPITPIAAAEQFRILVPLGPDRAIEAIRTSIANGWRGLFPAKASSAPADPDAFVRKPHDDDEVDQIMGWPKGTSKLGAEFAPTWKRWNEHLAELNRPMTTAATERQMAEFAAWGTERAVAAINHSITKNWSSIHEPKGANNGSEKHGTRTIVENLQL